MVAMGPRATALVAVSGPPACPYCGAPAVERVGQWGGQMITAQWRCGGCNSYFEAVRDDFDDVVSELRSTGPDRRGPSTGSGRS